MYFSPTKFNWKMKRNSWYSKTLSEFYVKCKNMYTVHVLEATDLYYKDLRAPNSYVMVYCEGNRRFLFGNTHRVSDSSNPNYDKEKRKPMQFPIIIGHKIGFKVFHHRTILSDVLIAEGELPIEKLIVGEDNSIELKPVFEQKCNPFLVFHIDSPDSPFEKRSLKNNLFFSYLTYDPPFFNKEESVGFKHFYIHCSYNTGEIHFIYPGETAPGAISGKEALFMTSTGKTHVFEMDFDNMGLKRTFGYRGDDSFLIIPCVYCPVQLNGTMIINFVAPKDHYEPKTDNEWADIRFYGRNEVFLSRQIPIFVESPGWYTTPLVFKKSMNDPETIPIFFSPQTDLYLLRDVIPHIIPKGVVTWTRLFSTETSPVTFRKSIDTNGLQWPESICVEIGWLGSVPNIHLTPHTYTYSREEYFSRKGIEYIHHKPTKEIIRNSNGKEKEEKKFRIMDGEKTTIWFSDIDPQVSYIVMTANVKDTTFHHMNGCYIRITDTNSNAELSFTKLEYPSQSTIFGVFYRIDGNCWDFIPSFTHGTSIHSKRDIQNHFSSLLRL